MKMPDIDERAYPGSTEYYTEPIEFSRPDEVVEEYGECGARGDYRIQVECTDRRGRVHRLSTSGPRF